MPSVVFSYFFVHPNVFLKDYFWKALLNFVFLGIGHFAFYVESVDGYAVEPFGQHNLVGKFEFQMLDVLKLRQNLRELLLCVC